ncbi:hypothetical protein Cgig2_017856 [Carnegiea gigantea]|uniref:Expansin n=1 Tax=Carnegiea gigantea TaxID=171969 RepID=A0A9Q1KYM4_9CARY|nr:hypothetical protein Cgig2_017856 [Carnegiea gigantea]
MALVHNAIGQDDWVDAQATFYGDDKGHGTEESTCGYDVAKQGYGVQTTALSATLFENGAICGACFEIKCVNSPWCIEEGPSIGVTATSSCPKTTTSTPNGVAQFCNPPTKHFYLPQPMFLKFAHIYSGVIPVQYRRYSCFRQGGVKFQLGGNETWISVLVFNVQSGGALAKIMVKGSSATWVPMTRDWGANWKASGNWIGQSLSFQMTDTYNKTLELENVVPPNWQFATNYLHVMAILLGLSYCVVGGSNGNHGWKNAHATFYGDLGGQETMYGACGYGDLFKQGYGLATTALSTALFNDGASCGACYEIRCKDSQWCKKDAGPIRVTATNFCPPWYHDDPYAWCNTPRKHFDLSMKMFLKIAEYKGGVVPVMYRKVKCLKKGGIKFELDGNPYWLLVLVYNVGGAGNVVGLNIKGSNSSWTNMSRNWGQNWQTWENLKGQSLSFQVTTGDGKQKVFENVAPDNWQLGHTYESKKNMN